MNREIKFEVWDTHLKTMQKNAHLYHEFIRYLQDDRYIKRQYIGLKDTDGIEIYDGDIIKYPNGTMGFVKWLSEEDGYDFTGWVTSYNNYSCVGNGNLVIGNIYQNANILTLEK